jgi:16S rRNA processing protein RimM
MTSGELIEIGKVSGAAGIKGEIKIHHYSGERERLAGVGEFFLEADGERESFSVESIRYNGRTPILSLCGVDNRNAAEALRGRRVFARREDLAPLEADGYYVNDLTGVAVEDGDGNHLGSVSEILDNPAHDILVVQPRADSTGGQAKNFFVPFVDVFILGVDVDAGGIPVKIRVSLPEGLAEARA